MMMYLVNLDNLGVIEDLGIFDFFVILELKVMFVEFLEGIKKDILFNV